MAEIRCPMCGKPNSDNLDICQYCQARLKPLIASPPPDDAPADGEQSGDAPPFSEKSESSADLPDWLDFDADPKLEEDEDEPFENSEPFDSEDDDWLSRLEGASESEDAPPLEQEAEPGEEQSAAARMDFDNNGIPDWMEDLEETRSTIPLEESQEPVEDKFPTWLAADEGSDTSSDLPDWLIDSGSEDEGPLPTEGSDLTDWMAPTEDQPTERIQEGDDEITLPDWTFEGDSADTQSELPSIDDDKSTLASEYIGQETVPNQDIQGDSELPDWLTNLVGEETTVPDETPLTQESIQDLTSDDRKTGVTDWLTGGSAEEVDSVLSPAEGSIPEGLGGEDDEELESTTLAAEGEPPDWLSELDGGDTAVPDEALPAQESIPDLTSGESKTGVTDWLSSGSAEEVDSVLSPAKDSIPDWTSGEDDGEEVSTTPAAEGELPDWLSELSGEPASPDGEIAEIEDVVPAQAPVPAFTADDPEELPDWLSDEDDGETESVLPATEGELPDWLSELGGEPASPDGEITEIEDVVPAQAPVPAFTADDPEELPDWLSDEDDGKTESVLPATEGDLPDGVSELDGEAASPDGEITEIEDVVPAQASVPAFTADDAEELPDWLSGEDDGETESALPADEGDLPDWLSDLGGDEIAREDTTEPEEPGHTKEAAVAMASALAFTADDVEEPSDRSSDKEDGEPKIALPTAEDDLPDWISDLGDEAGSLNGEIAETEDVPAKAPIPAFTADDAEELPDWLSDEDDGETEGTLPADEGDLPDWLSDLDGEAEEAPLEPASVPAFSADDAEELPDWLSDEDDRETKSVIPTDEGDLPDWLSDLDSESEETPLEPASAPAFSADDVEELPDWLSGEDSGEAESILPIDEGDLPSWLSDLGGEEITREETAEPDEPSHTKEAAVAMASALAFTGDDAEESPDWTSDEKDEKVESALPTDEADLPDWLSDLGGEQIAREDDVPDAAIPTFKGTEELPEWLAEVDGIEVELPEEIGPEIEPDIQPSIVDESRAVPDWLRETEGVPVGEALDDISLDDGLPELAEAVSSDLEDGFEEDLSDFDQLPEWLSGSSQTDVDQVQEITGPVDDIAPAELPGWLAAMRPVESAASEAADLEKSGPAVSSGPLAGLYSVLAAEPEITQLKKPPVYSNKLQVTDAQQTHATLLGDMLQTEGKPQALPAPALISSHRVFRMVLGIILIVITFIAVLVGGDMIAMPTSDVIPLGVEQTYQIIAALSPEDTALVAFDFEPGLVGEMDASAAAVVNNMMERGAKLVLVSTSPTGPALAERFIKEIQGDHQYRSGAQYVNLGYIPGGVSGLAAFAQNPDWITPTTLDGAQAWETEPLKNIRSVSDFSLLLVITDNPNTTRAWVEQVNPHIEPVPMVAVVSAQVDPVARTYYGQIDGLVSGLTGGAAYEVMGGSNLAQEQWDAFNIILIVAVSAILIGGIINIGSTMIARKKKNGGESA